MIKCKCDQSVCVFFYNFIGTHYILQLAHMETQ